MKKYTYEVSYVVKKRFEVEAETDEKAVEELGEQMRNNEEVQKTEEYIDQELIKVESVEPIEVEEDDGEEIADNDEISEGEKVEPSENDHE